MRINSYHICETLDWIPVVSTIAQIVHQIVRIRFNSSTAFNRNLQSSYGDYLTKYYFVHGNGTRNFIKSCPILNIICKIFELVLVLKNRNTPENIPSYLLPYHYKDNRDFMLKTINNHLYSFFSASYRLRNDLNFVLSALNKITDQKIIPMIFSRLSPDLQKNEQIVLTVLEKINPRTAPHIFNNLSSDLQNNKNIALAALNKASQIEIKTADQKWLLEPMLFWDIHLIFTRLPPNLQQDPDIQKFIKNDRTKHLRLLGPNSWANGA